MTVDEPGTALEASATPAPAAPAQERLAYHPTTGEIVNLASLPPGRLAEAYDACATLAGHLAEWRRAVMSELAARADRRGERSCTLGPMTFTVNAPAEDVYAVEMLESRLQPLVEQGIIDQELVDRLIIQPPRPPQPPAPPRRVDRRLAAQLMRSDNRPLMAALAGARRRVPQDRTVKVTRRAIETTQENPTP